MTINVAMDKAIDNGNWIVDDEVADPKKLPYIPGYHVLVRPVSVRKKTKGGIILTDRYVDDVSYLTTVGRVLKVGDIAYMDQNKFPNGAWCKEGDFVTYGKHAGQKMMYQGVKLILLYDDQVIMRIDNPGDLDTSYNLTNF